MMRTPWLALAGALLGGLLLSGCGPKRSPNVAYALEGPVLYVVADYKGVPMQGEMDRSVMVGVGRLILRGTVGEKPLVCEARFNAPPTEKGRVRGMLICSNETGMPLALRNLGPDQGVGIAMEEKNEALMVLFYHPSIEEAQRRLPQAMADMQLARTKK